MLGILVIANNIRVTTDSHTSIHRAIGHNLLFVKLSQEDYNKMHMLPSEETLLMTARILLGSVRAPI